MPALSGRETASTDRYGSSPSPPNSYADPYRPGTTGTTGSYRPITPVNGPGDRLISNAAPLGRSDGRQPTLPNVGGGGYGYPPNTGLAPAPLRTYGINPGNGGYGGYGGQQQQQQQQRSMNFSTPYRGSRAGY